MLVIFLAAAACVCVVYQTLAIADRYPLDYGEAPLVDQAIRLASGQNIYRADLATPPYTISNYPPVYLVALAPLMKLFGPSFAAGRLISTVSAWASAACLALIAYARSHDRLAAAMTGLLFLAIPYVAYWSALLRIDQLALALSLAALCLLVWWPAARWSLVAAGLLLVAAIYTRQSYALAAPLAAFVWLWTASHNWRRPLGLALLVGGLSLGLFLLLNLLTNGGFFFNTVTANVNEFSLDILTQKLNNLYLTAWVLIYLGAASLLLIRRWNPLYTLAAPYAVGATLSALTVGKVGSNVNYLLELCAALSLAAGILIIWSRKHVRIHVLRAALLALLVIQVGHLMRTTFTDYLGDLTQRRAMMGELHHLETMVAAAGGPILADEYMGMSILQGRPLYLQPFEVTQLAQAGVWDQKPLLESIHQQKFSLILIYDRPWYKERWTPEMLSAIQNDYQLTELVADTRVYRPSPSPGAPVAAAEACPGAPWRLPSDGTLGIQWQGSSLLFFGRGQEGVLAVRAVADGLLTRLPGWTDAVAVQHDDPLRPGLKVWTYSTEMSGATGTESYIAAAFPLASAGVSVRAGEVLGQQGSWSGRPQWPMWVHVRFAVVRAAAQGAFPQSLTPADFLDPTPYLGLSMASGTSASNLQPLRCAAEH